MPLGFGCDSASLQHCETASGVAEIALVFRPTDLNVRFVALDADEHEVLRRRQGGSRRADRGSVNLWPWTSKLSAIIGPACCQRYGHGNENHAGQSQGESGSGLFHTGFLRWSYPYILVRFPETSRKNSSPIVDGADFAYQDYPASLASVLVCHFCGLDTWPFEKWTVLLGGSDSP